MTVIRRPRAALARHRPWPMCRQCSGVALDMGSARTRAWVAGRGMILDVPTVTFPGAGAVYPIQRGSIVDTPGTARMLDRLLGHRLPRFTRPLVVVTAPVLDGFAYRAEARTAVEILRPRSVLTVPSARAVALAAGADLSRPLLVVDLGAHLTEVVLLVDGAVFDARRTALGTGDLDAATPATVIADAVAEMVTSMLRQDRTSLMVDALGRGPLLAGGGALRPEITCRLTARLHAPLRAVPAPHTAAVRGAAKLLEAAHSHPSTMESGLDPDRPDLDPDRLGLDLDRSGPDLDRPDQHPDRPAPDLDRPAPDLDRPAPDPDRSGPDPDRPAPDPDRSGPDPDRPDQHPS